jgi:hypothetical protein
MNATTCDSDLRCNQLQNPTTRSQHSTGCASRAKAHHSLAVCVQSARNCLSDAYPSVSRLMSQPRGYPTSAPEHVPPARPRATKSPLSSAADKVLTGYVGRQQPAALLAIRLSWSWRRPHSARNSCKHRVTTRRGPHGSRTANRGARQRHLFNVYRVPSVLAARAQHRRPESWCLTK